MSGDHLDLASEFPEPSREEWLAAVDKVLRGKPFDKVLVGATRDGIDLQPLYTAADDTGPAGAAVDVDPARVSDGWDVRQRHEGIDPAACNRAIIEDLERGVTSVEITAPAGGWTGADLRVALAGVMLDLAPVALAPHVDVDAANAFVAIVAERGDEATTRSWIGLDPIGGVARGASVDDLGDAVATCASVAAALAPTLPNARTLTVDATRYSDAGATEAQELGWAVATGIAYLRALESEGVAPAAAASTIGFRLTAGADQFTTLATMRAARRLWSRVLEASGVPAGERGMAVQAVTSRAMYSRRDPWVNMLRATTAALGAGVGGADAVTVLPFDDAIGVTDGFGRRTARNTQLLLLEESHLAKIVDPAAGSWFVESLTNRLAAAAWEIVQRVEGAGGMAAALADGSIAAAVDEAWNDRLGRLATRRDPLTGVSEFPLLDESELQRPPRPADTGLPVRRLAAPFEELRDAADRFAAASGTRPTVFLAALGDLAEHTARSTWITNFLAVGGVAAVGAEADGSQSPLEAEARFGASGSRVAVICSSDGVYAERAAATATALKEAGAVKVVVAGAPGDLRAELDGAGVDEYWHVGVDVLDVLGRLHADLGV